MNETKNSISTSLLATNVYAACFTPHDSLEILSSDLYEMRKTFFTEQKPVRINKKGIVNGLDGKLTGKLTKRSFHWKRTSGHIAIEESYDNNGGYMIVMRNYNNVITGKVFFDRNHMWIKSEYSDTPFSSIASILFKPVEISHAVERFDYNMAEKHYKSTILYPVPYLYATAQQSLINAKFGEPQFILATEKGIFGYCEEADAKKRNAELKLMEDGSVILMPAWDVKDGQITTGTTDTKPEPEITFTNLEEYAKITPARQNPSVNIPGPEAAAPILQTNETGVPPVNTAAAYLHNPAERPADAAEEQPVTPVPAIPPQFAGHPIQPVNEAPETVPNEPPPSSSDNVNKPSESETKLIEEVVRMMDNENKTAEQAVETQSQPAQSFAINPAGQANQASQPYPAAQPGAFNTPAVSPVPYYTVVNGQEMIPPVQQPAQAVPSGYTNMAVPANQNIPANQPFDSTAQPAAYTQPAQPEQPAAASAENHVMPGQQQTAPIQQPAENKAAQNARPLVETQENSEPDKEKILLAAKQTIGQVMRPKPENTYTVQAVSQAEEADTVSKSTLTMFEKPGTAEDESTGPAENEAAGHAEEELYLTPAVIEATSAPTSYHGPLTNGKISGRGRTEQANGMTAYDGEFSDGKREGFGSYYYKNGNLCYAGFWKDDKKDGLGVSFRNSDNALHIAKWQANEPSDHVTLFDREGNLKYSGRIKDGKKTGMGITSTPDGGVFVGHWADDKPAGMGSAFDSSGNLLYTGMWQDGKRNGNGTQFAPNGDIIFSGEWRDDKQYNGILYKKPSAENETIR